MHVRNIIININKCFFLFSTNIKHMEKLEQMLLNKVVWKENSCSVVDFLK